MILMKSMRKSSLQPSKLITPKPKTILPPAEDMKRCEVFANHPRDVESFKATLDMIAAKNPGTSWPEINKPHRR